MSEKLTIVVVALGSFAGGVCLDLVSPDAASAAILATLAVFLINRLPRFLV